MALLDSKFQPWENVREQLESVLRTTDPEEHCVMVPYGLQLAHTFHHPHMIRCMAFYHCTNGNIYVTQLDTGVINEFYFWTISSLSDEEVKCQRIQMNTLMSKIIFIPQHRVFVGYSPDVTLHVFSDLINNCMELTKVHCSETVLCMVYNEDMDELVTGGRGFIQAWKMSHVEIRDPLVRGRPIESEITEDDWVRDVRVDRKRHQLFALCDEGIHIIHYISNKEVYCIKNWHVSALTCFVFYHKLEYCITASMDGAIKVWNAVVFKEVHQFIGHYASVTGLVIHPVDPLLVSSSKDGTVRIWRLDTFELTHRLNVGEKVLGMKLANSHQLYYYTLNDIKVWDFNLFHHLFTPVRSCVHKLARVSSPSSPSRILCAAEDGGVRLISAVSGTELTIIYPMPSYQVLTDIVYDPKNALIFTVLEMGDVLVFDSSTNPCQARELLVPMMPEESVVSLALVKMDCANGREEGESSDYLIFAGLGNGQISLLESQAHTMKYPCQAHGGAVLALECSHGVYGPDVDNYIASGDRLISCGSDKLVKIWEIGIGNSLEAIRLCCRRVIACTISPSHISMLGNVLCTVLPTNVVEMYELGDDDEVSHSFPSSELAEYIAANKIPGIKLLKHLKDHDHTKQITALCSCPSLGLFATTSDDASLKIWDITNTLVRELWFDDTLRSVCFANRRGDLLVGFQNHISHVSIASYLPLSYMEMLLEKEFADEIVEEPFEFNPDLPLWFNLKTIPTFPTNMLMRQQVRKKLPQLRKQLLGLKTSNKEVIEEEEEEAEELKAQEDLRSRIEMPIDAERILQVPKKESTFHVAEKKDQVTVERKRTKPAPPKQEIKQVEKSISSLGNGDQAPPASLTEPTAHKPCKMDETLKGSEMDTSQAKDKEIKEERDEERDEEKEEYRVEEDVAMETEDGTDKDSADNKGVKETEEKREEPPEEETVMKSVEESEKESKIKLPIAPDGFIPNSVIRRIVQPPKPPPPPTPPEWKLKHIHLLQVSAGHVGHVRFAEESDVEFEDHDPFTWASSEESSQGEEITPIATPSPPPEPTFFQLPKPRRRRREVEVEDTVEDSKDARRLSMKILGKLILTHPGHSEDREKKVPVTSEKKKRKGRGISKEAPTLRKYGKRGTLADITQEGGQEADEEEEAGKEQEPVGALLKKIADEYWYPKGLRMDIYTTVKTLLDLLEGASTEHYRSICDKLLELNSLVGFAGEVLNSVIRRYLRDLKSSAYDTRINAVRTLKGLGDNRPDVVLAMLNTMADKEEGVKKEAAEAVDKLAGISTKYDMETYLASIGIMLPRTEDPFEDLARRYHREAQQGEDRLHVAAAHLLERRQSSPAPHPTPSYTPEMVEDWLHRYLQNKNLYQHKPRGLKMTKSIDKKKRRMSLAVRVRRPGEIETLEGDEDLGDEEASDYEIKEEECYDESENEDEDESTELEESTEEMESFAAQPEEEQRLPQPVKLNKHQAMMKAKQLAMEREKVIMERKAKEKMRKHIEEYEEAMKKKRRKMKHLLPYHPLFHKYYSKLEKDSGQKKQRTRRGIKAMLASATSAQETEASVVDEKSSHDSQIHVYVPDQTSYLSVVSEKDQTSLRDSFQQMVHLPIAEEEEKEDISPQPSVRKMVSQQVSREPSRKEIEARRIGKGVHYYLDRRRWEDEEMFAEGSGTPFRRKLTTTEPTGDSGLGTSMLTGTSQLLTGTGTSLDLSEGSIPSGGICPVRDRPKSNLTMANVRRHELLSAHKETSGSEIMPKENWRDFFLLPMIQEKRKHDEVLQALLKGHIMVQEEASKKPMKIKCVPSGAALTPGSSNQRVVHDITVGSKVRGQSVRGRGDVPEIPPLGKQGVTGYGALQMTWSNMVPRCPAQYQEGHCVTMGNRRRDLSLRAPQRNREEWRRYEASKKIWLRTQMLYPSLYALQEIDFIKRRLSDSRPNKKGNAFQWETPLPMVTFEPVKRQTKEPVKETCPMCDQEERQKMARTLPSIIQSENGDDIPIVPRNSIASSTCDPWTLPKISIRKKHASDGVKMPQRPLKEIPSQS